VSRAARLRGSASHALSARSALAALAALLALSGPAPAAAHETLHEVVRGKAVAVRAFFADGEPLAYAAYEVYAPADPRIPWQKGRTDRDGWLAFVPAAPGAWRVKVIDDTGHGLDLTVDAAAPAGPAAAGPAGAAFVLRPLLGLLAIGAVFAALVLAYRKKGRAP
jgi:nickel transport protein